jgi:hypothetical protein
LATTAELSVAVGVAKPKGPTSMPTNLPQRQNKTCMVPFLWAFVLVPVIYGIVAYNFILYERAHLEAHRLDTGQGHISERIALERSLRSDH